MTTPTPTVYRSRSRTTRQRLLVVAAVLVLVLAGFLVGRMQGGSGAEGSAVPPASPAPSSIPLSVSPPPPPTSAAPATPIGVDAYSPIQAENAVAQQGTGVQDTGDEGGGKNIGWVNGGDWLQFDSINFGDTAPAQMVARVASDVQNDVSRMEIRIDSPSNPPIGSLPIHNTGGWDAWRTQATDVTAVTGVHTVFVAFASDSGDDFLNLNYFLFSH
jgi:hypothetical protein